MNFPEAECRFSKIRETPLKGRPEREGADRDRNIVELRESPGWQLGDLGVPALAGFNRPPEGGTPAETEDDFMFQFTREEFSGLTSQNAISKAGRGGRRTPPYAFTEHGAVMPK
jgi:hypothetical protein